MTSIAVTLDASKLIAWATELSASKIRSTLASALNKSARAARKDFIVMAAKDINVPAARVKAAVGKIIRASPGNLAAKFVVGSSRIGIKQTAGASFAKGSGLTAASHVLTGGRSASLHAAKAFVINANGGQFIAIRTGKGKNDIRAVYAEGVNTAMSQADAAPRLKWIKDADEFTPREISAGIQRVLLGGSVPPDSGSDE
jgi:hypothetical protein